ncbi:MAG TPA: NADH-quinone oxidoreductase subunit L [Thermomicrobiales bacterium]|nr:NADH-quinone oxidoreductase subunit L [Thermomicrobiales bacterium]
MAVWLFLIPLLPLAAFCVNILLGRSVIRDNAHWVAMPAVGLSWLLSILVFFDIRDSGHAISQRLFTWIPAGDFNVAVSLYADQLTAIMLLVVTTVGFLVHVYSVGYMHGDPGFYRFFSYLPLFVFSMLMLVLADNLLVLFVFWEAVGLCSYLLIGYYFRRRSANNAAKKAFIVNRVGDLGFGLGVMLTFWTFGTINFYGEHGIFEQAVDHAALGIGGGTLTLIGILLFIGACGKSAQFPLHVWLPDAMEGPTPVSALIHAATMVTAGIYMVARNYTIYIQSETAMLVVAIVGAFTALMAATIALTQNDIKRVVAYSTVSQLGYMAFALGTGAWLAAIFHLMTHAFFKGLLFLGCGSVIHGMHEEQDIRNMGGLRKHMPVTFWTFLIGSLANAGVIPLAGFWSKDEIIVGAWVSDSSFGKPAAIIGLVAAFLTALYMFRLVFLVFFGRERFDIARIHPHESGPWMAAPLVLLAIPSAIIGFVGFPPEDGPFHHFLHHAFEHVHAHEVSMATTVTFGVISTVVALGGIGVAYLTYFSGAISAREVGARFPAVYQFLLNKWYIDELYDAIFVRPLKALSVFLWKVVDVGVIDAAVNGVALGIGAISQRLRHVQTGLVANYALAIALGMVVLVGVYLAGFSNLFR